MSQLIVLVGLPGSGKSSSIPEDFDGFIYSTDRYIESRAQMNGQTYDQMFKELIGPATQYMNEQLKFAIRRRSDVIWDQTNMSAKKRLEIMMRFPSFYHKICLCYVPPRNNEEWKELMKRIVNRKGKSIPKNVIEMMADSFVQPSFDEGFDEVYLYDIFGNQI